MKENKVGLKRINVLLLVNTITIIIILIFSGVAISLSLVYRIIYKNSMYGILYT